MSDILANQVMDVRTTFLSVARQHAASDDGYEEMVQAFDNAAADLLAAVNRETYAQIQALEARLRDELTGLVQIALDEARRLPR